MTIRSARAGDVVLSESLIAEAIRDLLPLSGGKTEKELTDLVYLNAGKRDAAGWAEGIRIVHAALTRPADPCLSGTAKMIDQYARLYPPVDSSGNRLALSDTGRRCVTAANGGQPMSDADAASEINRLCLSNHQPNGRVRFDMGKVAGAAIQSAPVALSQEREYTDSSELRLTAPAAGQADVETYLQHLASQAQTAKFIDLSRHAPTDTTSVMALAQGEPDRTDAIDSAAQSLSDLTQQAVQDSQSWQNASWSDQAQQELDGLPDHFAAPLASEVQAANQAGNPADAASHLLRAFAYTGNARHVRAELAIRLRSAVDAAASYVPSPADAQAQVAGTTNVEDEVRRLSTLASAPRTGNTTGNIPAPKRTLFK